MVFSQETDDRDWIPLRSYDQEEQVSITSSEMERPLSEQEKDVVLDCVSTMLTAKTLDASLLGVLQTIGEYYHADRVYTLILVENRHAVIMTFEWTNSSKRSIQQVVSGMQLERFPLLERCMAEQAPVFLTRNISGRINEDTASGTPWHFTAFPLIRNKQVEGFLCIENARNIQKIRPYLARLSPIW